MAKPYSKNWGWSSNYSKKSEINKLDKKDLNDYNITLQDLENRYKDFCVYVKEPYFHGSVFKMWGINKIGSSFKHRGYQKFI